MKSHQKLKYFKKAKSFEESCRSPIKRKAKKTISEPRKYAFKDFSSLRIKSVKKSVKSRISFRAPKHSVDLVKKIRNGFKTMRDHKESGCSYAQCALDVPHLVCAPRMSNQKFQTAKVLLIVKMISWQIMVFSDDHDRAGED